MCEQGRFGGGAEGRLKAESRKGGQWIMSAWIRRRRRATLSRREAILSRREVISRRLKCWEPQPTLHYTLEGKIKVSLNLEVKGDTFWSMWRKSVPVLRRFGIP